MLDNPEPDNQPAKAQPHLASAANKAEMKKFIDKGATKSKTAKTPARQKRLAAKIKAGKQTKAKLSAPGELARCRAIVGGDLVAAALLYRIAHFWRVIKPKLERHGKEWIAQSREDWALSAGLSSSELKNRALPRLREHAFGIVEVRQMGRGEEKKIWISFDPAAYNSAIAEGGYEAKVSLENGVDPFH